MAKSFGKYFIYFACIILFVFNAVGQNKHVKVELSLRGNIQGVSVSPNECIWLTTALGKTYYADSINGEWHVDSPEPKANDDLELVTSHLDRISFFNKDTAIMTGYIYSKEKSTRTSGVYFTRNAGKSWTLLDYGGSSWIYTAWVNTKGEAWLGGLQKELYYSNDFGQTWRTIKLPYKESGRTYSVCMSDSNEGIAVSDENEIIVTRDNWKTVENISTPFSDKRFAVIDDDYNNRIDKARIWGNYFVLNKNGHVFYTEKSKINWESFPTKIIDFEIEPNPSNLFGITKSLKVVLFSNPTKFDFVNEKPITSVPLGISVANSSLFVYKDRYDIYKINSKEFVHVMPYTIQNSDSIFSYYESGKVKTRLLIEPHLKKEIFYHENGKVASINYYGRPKEESLCDSSFDIDGKKESCDKIDNSEAQLRTVWDAKGRIIRQEKRFPSRSTTSLFEYRDYTYNSDGRIIKYEYWKGYQGCFGGRTIRSKDIEYDDNGKVISKSRVNWLTEWWNDKLGKKEKIKAVL